MGGRELVRSKHGPKLFAWPCCCHFPHVTALAHELHMGVRIVTSTFRNETDARIPFIINILPLRAVDAVFLVNHEPLVAGFCDVSSDISADGCLRQLVSRSRTPSSRVATAFWHDIRPRKPDILQLFICVFGTHCSVEQEPICHDDATRAAMLLKVETGLEVFPMTTAHAG